MTFDDNCCEDFLQLRHWSCQELFLSLFLHFCLCNLLLLKFLRVFHLFNLKLSHKHFQNRVPCWTKQRKQVSNDIILFIYTLIDHGQWPITVHVALISLHKVLYIYLIFIVNSIGLTVVINKLHFPLKLWPHFVSLHHSRNTNMTNQSEIYNLCSWKKKAFY